MNPSLVTKFQAINTILSEIKESPEWVEYDKTDNRLNECTFYAIEEAVNFFIEQGELMAKEKLNKAVEEAIKFFVANGHFPDSVVSQEEFDEESESASTPFI